MFQLSCSAQGSPHPLQGRVVASRVSVITLFISIALGCLGVPAASACGPEIVAAASGARTTVILRADGSAWSLGSSQDVHGPYSDGGEAAMLVPLPLPATAVAAGDFGAALCVDGSVWSWGFSADGLIELPGLPVIAHLGVVGQEVLMIDATGVAWSMTLPGSTALQVGSFVTPVPLVAAAFGTREIAGLDSDGVVWRLRRMSTCPGVPQPLAPTIAEQAAFGSPIVSIAAAGSGTLALDATGQSWIWGCFSDASALDPGVTVSDAPVPSALVPGATAVAMRAGTGSETPWGSAFFALDAVSGSAWAWGLGSSLGDGEGRTRPAASPAQVGVPGLRSIAPGTGHLLAIDASGDLWAWGLNSDGEAFARVPIVVREPAEIPGLTGVVDVVASDYHALAVTSDGRAWGWGAGWFGQLGTGPLQTVANRPLEVPGTGYVACSTGYAASAFLKADGTVWTCGMLVDGGPQSTLWEPVVAPGINDAIEVAAGAHHVLALRADGTVWGWGDNRSNQLGLGAGVPWQLTPALVPGLDGIVGIGASEDSSSALRNDGSVWFWGSNEGGRMGLDTPLSVAPMQAQPGPFTRHSQGGWHSLALDASGQVTAWGWSIDGALGVVDPPPFGGPVIVDSLSGIESVDSGCSNSHAIRPDGSVLAWGANYFGLTAPDLPDGSIWEPRVLPGLPPIAEIASGWSISVARTRDGRALSWGSDEEGQLGRGRAYRALDPVLVPLGDAHAGLGSSLRVTHGMGETLLTWGSRFGTSTHRVYRATLPDMSDELLAVETPGTSWVDPEPATPLWFYRVAAVDCAGVEGP